MFTRAGPPSQTYHGATVFWLPSGAAVPMIAGFGLRRTCWSASGSGGLGMVECPTRSRRDPASRREVNRARVRDVRRVPAREHDAPRRAGAVGGVEDERVARREPGLG